MNLHKREEALLNYSKKVRPGETWTINDGKTRGHKSTITKVKGNEVRHIPRTHSPTTSKKRNIPLQENPQKSDNRKTYIAPRVRKSNLRNVGKRQINQDIKNPVDKSVLRHLKKQDKMNGK